MVHNNGHYWQIGSKPYKKFEEWAKSLGDIYRVQMGQQNWIILTSDKVVGELLQKRGKKYSSRWPTYYFYQILERNKGFIGSPYHERYRILTPIIHGILDQRNIKRKSDLFDTEFQILMQNLYQASMNAKNGLFPKFYFQLTSLNIITLLCSGKRTKSIEDPFYKDFENYMENHLQLIRITNRLGDFFPFLRLFTSHELHERVIRDRKRSENLYGKLIKEVMNDKEKKSCIIRDLLYKVEDGILDELDIIHIISNLFSAGTDTISASLTWIVAALANNPQVQFKAHQELDQVIGQSRLPTIFDEQNIPYIRAIVKESQRYCGPIYLGIPHYIEEDDEYNGYHIPANSVIILNQYGIHMDEKRYENPKELKPERFLSFTNSSAALANGNYENRDHFGFGAGRRLCAGIHMAELALLLGVSRLLWCFRIENVSPLGKDGKPIPIDMEKIRFGMTIWPEIFHVKFVKRHDNVEKVLFKSNSI
ncbi:20745_t:CDS:2 [Cetraspora pellucida]|uniref:20745_t:CDS:1 n=1 Tax=Cetraspora pellucida TaxID=1433469 RepID=A0A9N8YUH6_9GLOM|nr:20745_t:CDS:2 [Cetraspora pellucida]